MYLIDVQIWLAAGVSITGVVILMAYGMLAVRRVQELEIGRLPGDLRRRRESYARFEREFRHLGSPERVTSELFGILWRDVLWAVRIDVTPETAITAVYLPEWVDVGTALSAESELRKRCGLDSETASTCSVSDTFGELIASVSRELSRRQAYSDELLLVRPSDVPFSAILVRQAGIVGVDQSVHLRSAENEVGGGVHFND